MKTCPSCGKEYEDSMKFCQVDGATLADAKPELDPYATMVGHKLDLTKEEPKETPAEPMIHETTGSLPIGQPDEILELPAVDPLKTMYVSESELKEALGTGDAAPAAPVDEPLLESSSESEPTIVAEPPAFGAAPPPSPFSVPDAEPSRPFAEPEPLMPSASSQFGDSVSPAPAEWTPPPVPDASWKGQPIDSNTPFQPPPAGAAGPSSGLAIGSLISGILSCICCFPILTGPLGIILGVIAKKKADENPAEYAGRGLAMGGIITGAIGILLGVIQIIWILFFNGLAMLNR